MNLVSLQKVPGNNKLVSSLKTSFLKTSETEATIQTRLELQTKEICKHLCLILATQALWQPLEFYSIAKQ